MPEILTTGVPRDDRKVAELSKKKFDAWSRLRAARAEMKNIDMEMIKSGATIAELEHLCW
jgi:hypothetical protein